MTKSTVTHVRTMVGAFAYAVLRISNGVQFDIRLDPGASASASLLRYADAQESLARDAQQRADWARQASQMLSD